MWAKKALSPAMYGMLRAIGVQSIVVDPLNGGFNALPADVREALLAEPVVGLELVLPPFGGQRWKRKYRKRVPSFDAIRRRAAHINRQLATADGLPLAKALLTIGMSSAVASLVACTPVRPQPLCVHLPPLRWLENAEAAIAEQEALLLAWLCRAKQGDAAEPVAQHVFGFASPTALAWAHYYIAISADVRQRVALHNRPQVSEFIA